MLILLACAVGTFLLRTIYPFLAVHHPVTGGILVVEGWVADYALEAAAAEFKRGAYDTLYVTGGPLEYGAPLSEYKSYAELGAAVLLKQGLATNAVQAVPAPYVQQDRTYASAVALKQWLMEHQRPAKPLNLVTIGPHARRSRLLYRKVFGEGQTLGVINVPVQDYDPERWWKKSAGFRAVVDETVAFLYARLIFNP